MRKSLLLSSFLDAVNVAAVAIMLAVLIVMSAETLLNWKAIIIAALSVLITFGFKKVSVMWIILGGSIVGYLLHFIG